MDDQKEKKTEKADETKDTTAEATPKDKADALAEKTLAMLDEEEKKKRQITKTVLGAVILVLFSMLCLWICSTTDIAIKESHLAGAFFFGLAISLITSLAVARFVAWNKDKGDFLSIPVILLLWCISFLPLAIGIVPFSKYHNQNQIKRDTIISEAYLQIKVLKDGIEILLPSEHTSENSYLEKVFSIGWEEKNYPWKTTADYCQKGKKIWYETKLPFPDWYRSKLAGNPFSIPFSMMTEEEKKKYESNTDSIILFFKHLWENYEITKEISFPDPNSL